MDLNILGLTYFLILKRTALALFSLMERSLTRCCQVRFVSIFTIRYLTLSVGYSLLLLILFLNHLQIFFCLDLKITISVFLMLSEILFAFNQLTRCFKSALTCLFSFLIELLRHNQCLK